MTSKASADGSSPFVNSGPDEQADPELGPGFARKLLVAAIPAVLIGLLIRAWLLRSALLPFNADEAITGLQAIDVLNGTFRLVVAGNQYGSTTESYLFAPLLLVWSGPWPLRVGTILLSVVAAYALYRLARPTVGRTVAVVVGLVGWTLSGAIVAVWSHPYMGYPSGFIAQVVTLTLACHAMRTTQHLARTAFFGGLAAGFAIWSHPMFGVAALLALVAPTVLRWRHLRSWWLPVVGGGVVGVSPWLVFMIGNGLPVGPAIQSTYSQRIELFFIDLMPRVLGVRAPNGIWLNPSWLAVGVVGIVVIGSLCGLVILTVKRGAEAVPILVTGVLVYPVVALFPALTYAADGRYGVPFVPTVLMGLAAWALLLPNRVRTSPWLVVVIPTTWALALCVPVMHHQIGWNTENPDAGAEQVTAILRGRDVHYLGGYYWGVYLIDYLAGGTLVVRPDDVVRFPDEAEQFAAADPANVAYIYNTGQSPVLPLPTDRYSQVTVGNWDLYLPKGN